MRPNAIQAREKFTRAAEAVRPTWSLDTDDEENSASLHLYGVIGGFWGDIDAARIVPAIRDLKANTLYVYINSPGGDVYDSIALRNALRNHPATVTVTVDGLAASGGSVIATAADEVIMSEGAEIMIHDAWTIGIGDAADMRAVADDLDRISDNIASMYARKAGGKAEDWRALMIAETWYSAEEAVTAGLADRINYDEPADQAASNVFDLSMYAHAGRAAAMAPSTRKETAMPPSTADLEDIRTDVADVKRSLTVLLDRPHAATEPAADMRSAGEWLKAIVAGDQDTIEAYNALLDRPAAEYTGGTTTDTVVKPGFVGDLTRIFDASSGVLADTFSTGTLPSEGNSIEFAELDTNTLSVAEQASEGADIAMGKVSIKTRTAQVKTYAGGTELTRQAIERSTIGVLNTSLNGLAIAAGARKKAVLRAAYAALITERKAIAANGGVVTLGATLAAATAGNWEDALIDAALKFETINLGIERMIVSASVFKKLRSLTVSGERVFRVGEKNNSGTLDLPGLRGDFASIDVRLDSGQTGDEAVFVNSLALRQYDSSLVSLSDEKISNLTKSFAVYRYGAVAAEIPAGIVPVKLAAS